ncbi:MAG TPA: hypothetical protein PKO06_20315, partial [Candidatus Ozemobacteraceae bacterium]|nr:hypothetical protein [Candidatus Ozemobacteraceae bacterium]
MRWKDFLLGLVFVLFPIALAMLGNSLLFDDPVRIVQEQLEERLAVAMDEVESRKDYAEQFRRVFRAVENRVFRAADP